MIIQQRRQFIIVFLFINFGLLRCHSINNANSSNREETIEHKEQNNKTKERTNKKPNLINKNQSLINKYKNQISIFAITATSLLVVVAMHIYMGHNRHRYIPQLTDSAVQTIIQTAAQHPQRNILCNSIETQTEISMFAQTKQSVQIDDLNSHSIEIQTDLAEMIDNLVQTEIATNSVYIQTKPDLEIEKIITTLTENLEYLKACLVESETEKLSLKRTNDLLVDSNKTLHNDFAKSQKDLEDIQARLIKTNDENNKLRSALNQELKKTLLTDMQKKELLEREKNGELSLLDALKLQSYRDRVEEYEERKTQSLQPNSRPNSRANSRPNSRLGLNQ